MPTMTFDFGGKRAFISGSTSGIGAATARLLAASGASVCIHGRNRERAERVRDEIREQGGHAIVALGALDSAEDMARVGEVVQAELGGVDILVCNAAESQPFSADWLATPVDDWLKNYNHNVGGTVRLLQAFVPGMKARGHGRVILIGSTASFAPTTAFPTYGPSKAALANVMVNLSEVLANTGITVNTVSPGAVLTETMASNLRPIAAGEGWTETDLDVIERRLVAEKWPNSVGRMGRAEEIAATIAFVASEEAGYMTGTNIRVNGGEKLALH